MDIEKICSDAKLTGWSPETTIKHLHDLAEHFPQLSFSHNSRTDINAEVVGALRHGIYAIANLMRENAALQIENERLRDELERCKEKNAGLALALLTECAPNPDCLGNDEWRAIRAELEQVKRERDEAIKTIFQWVGCPECKWWDSADEWCEKYDREADSCGGCESPEWRGQEE